MALYGHMANLVPLGVIYFPLWAKLRTGWSGRICEVRTGSALRCKRVYTTWAGYSSDKVEKATHAHSSEPTAFLGWDLFKIIFSELEILYLHRTFSNRPYPKNSFVYRLNIRFQTSLVFQTMAFNRIAVYGHRGFVASRVVPVLIASGAPITVLHRSTSDTSNLPEHVRKIEVDVFDEDALVRALQDIDIVLSVRVTAHLHLFDCMLMDFSVLWLEMRVPTDSMVL